MAPLAGGAIVAAGSAPDDHASPIGASTSADRGVISAALPPRPRVTPPMGFARSKRVIYGANRGPFQTGNMR
jgi:hypothetical protein